MFPLFNILDSFEFYDLDIQLYVDEKGPGCRVKFGRCKLCGMPFAMHWRRTDQDVERVRVEVFEDHISLDELDPVSEICENGEWRTEVNDERYMVGCSKIGELLRELGLRVRYHDFGYRQDI